MEENNKVVEKKKGMVLFKKGFKTEMLLVLILAILFIFFSIASPVFFKVDTLMKLLKQASIYGIIAIGMVYVITSSGIDLSVGSVVGLSGVIVSMAMTSGWGIVPATLIALVASALVGMFNGVLIFNANVPPFIATLSSMTIVRNMILLITGAKTISGLPEAFTGIASGSILGVPNLFLCWLAIILISLFISKKTIFGRNMYAYGSNKEAARLSGINTRMTVYGVYVYSAVLCGIAGILLTSRLGNGVPTSGDGYEVDAIAAAVVGGASMDGGVGSVIGTVLGATIMAMLRQGGTLLGINSFIMEIIISSLIAVAVIIDMLRKRGK
ncbi:MAG: ABC transporter permease [Lachnospiraceae bacterium]|nr:ABC transporter permease [Lachnospiraceae bacterium]